MDNPLVSTIKSTSGLQVVLHPLVLLAVSDYITRHTIRSQSGPIACGLIGQTHGREITIEHAFECQTTQISKENGDIILSADWFSSRLEQMTQVHKDRQLDLVGWATVLPQSGPEPFILPIHQQILSFNESAVLLAIHPELISNRSWGGDLPLTIYESRYEVEGAIQQNEEDMEMKDNGDSAAMGSLKLKFNELPYTVETDEAEMIGMETVAKTAIPASAIGENTSQKSPEPKMSSSSAAKAVAVDKGKRRIIADSSKPVEVVLSREEEEMIATLTGKANAIKMLQSRLNVLNAYLARLPPNFISGEEMGIITEAMTQGPKQGSSTIPNYNILRSIQALVSRLPLIIPSDEEAFNNEVQHEKNDVKLIGLLNEVISQTVTAKNIGRKVHIVEQGKGKNRQVMSFMDPQVATAQTMTSLSAGDLM